MESVNDYFGPVDQLTGGAAYLWAGYLKHSLRNVNGRVDIQNGRWTPFPITNAMSNSKLMKSLNVASKPFFVVGTTLSVGKGINAGINGDIPGVGKASTDAAMGTISFFGGPPGWVAGASYFIFDATVGVESLSGPLADKMCAVSGNC
ncbi:hypothetical protein [Microbulbifer rhizosphaerae]|uniref:Uncharacterized protein n=1 Tax=Microbulbifer rhizosphaerae TaxID=1562603 RepID=A0A7W4WA79_9GAMM|nr:hypothetical protein [Microbulbifer rhizosphaerae]MBB3060484.1 hypothetical protein [Microbulbifer rhizosphaerae]